MNQHQDGSSITSVEEYEAKNKNIEEEAADHDQAYAEGLKKADDEIDELTNSLESASLSYLAKLDES